MGKPIKERALTSYVVIVMPVASILLYGCVILREGASVDRKAVAVWLKHESVFQKALKGAQKDDDFEDARRFFEQTTGLTTPEGTSPHYSLTGRRHSSNL